jgi:hypothetical protein
VCFHWNRVKSECALSRFLYSKQRRAGVRALAEHCKCIQQLQLRLCNGVTSTGLMRLVPSLPNFEQLVPTELLRCDRRSASRDCHAYACPGQFEPNRILRLRQCKGRSTGPLIEAAASYCRGAGSPRLQPHRDPGVAEQGTGTVAV